MSENTGHSFVMLCLVESQNVMKALFTAMLGFTRFGHDSYIQLACMVLFGWSSKHNESILRSCYSTSSRITINQSIIGFYFAQSK